MDLFGSKMSINIWGCWGPVVFLIIEHNDFGIGSIDDFLTIMCLFNFCNIQYFHKVLFEYNFTLYNPRGNCYYQSSDSLLKNTIDYKKFEEQTSINEILKLIKLSNYNDFGTDFKC